MNLFSLLETIPWKIGAVLMAAGFILVTSLGVLLVRATVSAKELKGHHDVAAVVFANIGVLYSVLLGFTVVNVQQRFDKIKENTQIEASYLIELHRDAEVFDDLGRQRIRDALLAYSKSVLGEEWPAMSSGKVQTTISPPLNQVWNAYYDLKISDKKQELWYAASIDKLNLLVNARLSRLLGSKESLGEEMWTMLILGAVVLGTFICFFGLDNLISHLLMASILAGITGFMLFLIYSLDTIFTGGVNIPPEAMENFFRAFS